ncbi:MAG: NUDIX domain-containing protein [Micromonosporaceae bacterium]|nr:NUDIX domain-containing protein [Micromonosporaceae bacterium]
MTVRQTPSLRRARCAGCVYRDPARRYADAMKQRHRSIVDVHLIIRREGRIVMLRRANTGYGDGRLHLPSGHLERNESVVDGVIREAKEEIGVKVEPSGSLLLASRLGDVAS